MTREPAEAAIAMRLKTVRRGDRHKFLVELTSRNRSHFKLIMRIPLILGLRRSDHDTEIKLFHVLLIRFKGIQRNDQSALHSREPLLKE